MARKNEGLIEILLSLAQKLPWPVTVGLALASYIGLHIAGTLPRTLDNTSNIHAIGQGVIRIMAIQAADMLQYAVPVVLLFGAGLAAILRRRNRLRHAAVAKNPTQQSLEQMSWLEFEGLVAEAYRQKGFKVMPRGGNGPDGGVDVELRMGQDKYLVQCKQWKTQRVGVVTVRELYGVMAAEGAVGGFLVTSGEFTPDAQAFAQGRGIELVPAKALLALVTQHASKPTPTVQPITQPAVENTPAGSPLCPKCNSPMSLRTAQKGPHAGQSFWGCPRFPACRGTRQA